MALDMVKGMEFKRVLELIQRGRPEQARALLAQLQERFLSLCQENENLRRQMDEVTQILNLAESVEFDGQKYWLNENFRKKGPYCQVCYDRDALLVRLQEHDKHWHCQGCGNLYLKRAQGAERKQGLRAVQGKTIPLFVD